MFGCERHPRTKFAGDISVEWNMFEGITEEETGEVDKAIDNIEWARDSCLDGEILKANSHLHRAEELLQEYKESH